MNSVDLAEKRKQLLACMGKYQSCLVAFSGGVDSSLVAKAACLVLGDRAIAITANSPSLASGELEQAQEFARAIGIRHEVVETAELEDPRYVQNGPDRCYYCKSELYDQLERLQVKFSAEVVFSGANADDLGDYRPGLQAAREHQVSNPLADCGFTKEDVRELASYWDLPVWDKPAMPCLSSRVAYGEAVTPERLRMIDQAEQLLRSEGFSNVRVRYHQGDLARLEVPRDALDQLNQLQLRELLVEQLTAIGFKFVTMDLAGFRSGNLNQLVSLELTQQEKEERVRG